MIEKVKEFFAVEIWKTPIHKDKPVRSFFTRAMRIIYSAYHGFQRDNCFAKASALTYYSMLSIVPVMAVVFGIAKGFGFANHLEVQLRQRFVDQKEAAETIINFAYSLLSHAQGSVIAGIGIVTLFWSVLRLLGNIESTLNDIWKVKKPRSWRQRFSDYLAIMIFCPLFFAASSSLSIFIMTQIIQASQKIGYYEALSPIITLIFEISPFILCWMLFSFLYILMPNVRVQTRYGIIAGILAGSAYQIVQLFYIKFQIGVSNYGAIYGSFAALPLFLLWLQISWLIVLAGAEIAYHSENESHELSGHIGEPQQRVLLSKKHLAILIAYRCIQAFANGKPPLNITQITLDAGVSQRNARDIINDLVDSGLLIEVKHRIGEECYYPARDVSTITIKHVSDAMDHASSDFLTVNASEVLNKIDESLRVLHDLSVHSPANISLKNL